MTRFPILTDRLTVDQAPKVACLQCGEVFQVADATCWMVAVEHGSCPVCGSKRLEPAYEEADRCRGCGKLSLDLPLSGCCSRVCLLQAAYADQLRYAGSAGE